MKFTREPIADEKVQKPCGKREVIVCCVVVTVYIGLALALAATRPPQTDEGHFANAAAAIAFQGRFVMPMWTEWIKSLDQRVYSNMPLYFLVLGGWFKFFGVSWLSMRAMSIVFGIILIVSFTSVARSISRDCSTMVVTFLLLALNYDIINLTSARYDIMSAGLSAAALAVYLKTREKSFEGALLGAGSLQAAAFMTHPYGAFGVLGLVIFVITLDFKRLRARHIALAALPFFVAAAAWAAYIAQDPAMFRAQWTANTKGHFSASSDLIGIISSEIRERYLIRFAGWRSDAPLLMRVKILLLAAYAVGVSACLATRQIRTNPAALALVAYAVGSALLLTFVDALHRYVYLIHVLPLLVVCLGLAAGNWLHGRGWIRVSAYAGVAAIALFSVASVAYRVRLDVHHRAYLPTLSYLQSHVQDGDLVMAGGEFGLGLGFEQHVLDDLKLGFYNKRLPTFFVTSTESEADLDDAASRDAALRLHVARIMAAYKPVFQASAGGVTYRVFSQIADRPK